MRHFTILFLIILSIDVFAQDVKLKLASDVWPPFTNTQENEAFAFELVGESLHRNNVEFENDIVGVTDVIKLIKEGVYHGSSALWKDNEREEYLLFSDAYLQNQLILVGLRGADVSAHKLSKLFNKKVAIVESYAYGPEIEEASRVNFVKGKSDQENLTSLMKGQVDYILVDHLLIQYLMSNQQKEVAKYLAIGSEPLFTRSLHFAIRKDVPNADSIIQRFNTEIKKMMADGTYNRILQLHWIRADVDGDGQLELVLSGDQAGLQAPSNSYSIYFKDSKKASTNWGRYYINGKLYNGWEEIPNEYKVAQASKETFTFLKLSF